MMMKTKKKTQKRKQMVYWVRFHDDGEMQRFPVGYTDGVILPLYDKKSAAKYFGCKVKKYKLVEVK